MTMQVVAIDGPSYVGKSSVSKTLAERLGYLYINTGHMYRAVAKLAMEKGLDPKEERAVTQLALETAFQFETAQGFCRTVINGEDWSRSLDQQDIVFYASKISGFFQLREILTRKQREFPLERPVVMEGRDIGTNVFPDATWKFFITSSVQVRARRMYKMMTPEERSQCADFHLLIPKIQELDEIDKNRKIAPLRIAEDAIIYDNSNSPSEVQDAIILEYYITHHEEIIQNTEILKQINLSDPRANPLWKA